MPDPVEQRLAVLPTLSKAALCDLWKQLFDSTPPSQLRRDLMIPILAYRIQEQAFGALGAIRADFLCTLDCVAEREPHHRFVIALRSPDRVVETGLPLSTAPRSSPLP
jgi:hypothetical protein